MGSVHVPRPRWARPRRGRRRCAALAVAVLTALALVSGMQHAAFGATDAPYGGTAAAVPGTVYAANYDTGGQGVAYNVTSTNGSANSYRSDGVDLEDTADTQDTSAAGGAYDMGWTTAGQWFNYTVDVATAGTYTVAFRLSSPYGITDALHIANSSGTNLTGSVAVPNTGGYETWTTVDASITLPAGQQTLTVDQDSNGWNFHYMAFTLSSGGGWRPSGDQPFGGTPARRTGHGAGGELRHRWPGRGLQRHLHQRHREQLPLRRGRPRGHRGHAGHQRGGRCLRHGLDDARPVVQLHRRGRHRRGLHGQLPGGLAVRDHRRAAHRQLLRHQPDRLGRRPEHRRVRDLDHGHRQHHPAGRPADADRRPGLQRLELPLPGLHPGIGQRGRHTPRSGPSTAARRTSHWTSRPRPPRSSPTPANDCRTTRPTATPAPAGRARPATRSGSRSTSVPRRTICSLASTGRPRTLRRSSSRCPMTTRPGPPSTPRRTGTGGNETFPVSVTARYVRMYGTARATQFGYSIFELHVYGLTTTPPAHGRQRQWRQRHLPVGRLYRAGRPAGPAGAQHHRPVRRGQPALW